MKGSIRKRGNSWSYYFTAVVDGKKKRMEKGGYKKKTEAEKALREAIYDYENGEAGLKKSPTFKFYADYWFETVGNFKLRHNSKISYRSVLKVHLNPVFGETLLSDITPVGLQDFFTDKQHTCKRSLLITFVTIFNHIFKLAVKQGYLNENPVRRIEVIKPPSPKREMASLEDFRAVEKELIETDSPHLLPVQIAFHTGMRRGEVLGLTWEHVDFKNETINICQQLQMQNKKLVLVPLKTRASYRKIKMTQTLKKIMERAFRYKTTEFVCAEINPSVLTNFMLGKNLSFHTLRHLHATLMLESGANVKVIQNRLGHANVEMTLNTYSHLTEQMEVESVTLFDRHTH